jgi:uridine kinase
MIGIAGGSGSGKTTIAEAIRSALPDVVLVQHDSYYRHRPELTFEERSRVNYDHPASLETDLLVRHLKALARGAAIDRPTYDFSRHLRTPATERIGPAPFILVEGILVLADKELRDLFHFKIYVDNDPDIRLARRLGRDMEERGRSAESVLEQYFAFVRPMQIEFIEPSKRFADLIIPAGYDPAAVAAVVDLIRAHPLSKAPSIYSPT